MARKTTWMRRHSCSTSSKLWPCESACIQKTFALQPRGTFPAWPASFEPGSFGTTRLKISRSNLFSTLTTVSTSPWLAALFLGFECSLSIITVLFECFASDQEDPYLSMASSPRAFHKRLFPKTKHRICLKTHFLSVFQLPCIKDYRARWVFVRFMDYPQLDWNRNRITWPHPVWAECWLVWCLCG